jgi:hypothetical protein
MINGSGIARYNESLNQGLTSAEQRARIRVN